MINDIINGISITLNQKFGNGVEIHREGIEQGLDGPCFFIMVLNPSRDQILGNRSYRRQPFDIHYFPEVMGSNQECQQVAADLYETLETITLVNGDMIRGLNMNHEVQGGVLHFFVRFDAFVYTVEAPGDDMTDLTVNNGMKG